MAETSIVKRLGIRPGYKLLILNAPDGYVDTIGTLPEGVQLHTSADGGKYDLVQTFTSSKADVDRLAPTALVALKDGGLLWFAYPKKTSKIKTDINRDVGWDVVNNAGMEGVAIISLDDTWSSLRFRPSQDIKSRRQE
jgi:hypothetical protein